jgi:recombination protein RecA
MPEAIEAMLGNGGVRRARRIVGTPGAPNRPLTGAARDREEQIATDRLPARRGDYFAHKCGGKLKVEAGFDDHALSNRVQAETMPLLELPAAPSAPAPAAKAKQGSGPQALDQALRATDLLLSNGGFGAIVLDLGGIPVEWAWKIPLATWFRYRAACDRSRTTLLLLTRHGCARSSAELVVRLRQGAAEAQGQVLTGFCWTAETERSRFHEERKRVQRAASWVSEAAWA